MPRRVLPAMGSEFFSKSPRAILLSPARDAGEMRICFVVNNVRTQRATYTTAHLAFAAHRRGHDVAFASADALSYGHAGAVTAEVVRPPVSAFTDSGVFVRGLTS